MVEVQLIEKPFRKLRKMLRHFPADARIEDVHKLRTHVRRVESLIAALDLDRGDGLLKKMADIRRAAGHVRDMDVLEAKTLTLSNSENADSVVWLLEYLGHARTRDADRLSGLIALHRKALRRGIDDCLSFVEKEFRSHAPAANRKTDTSISTNARRATLSLVNDIFHWPELDRNNVHEFRLKLKELRSLLQLNPSSASGLVEALGQSKDMIGEWHDWYELSRLAAKVLNDKGDRSVLAQINQICGRNLKQAIASANAMRMCYFFDAVADDRGNRDPGLPLLIPATEAAMSLVSK